MSSVTEDRAEVLNRLLRGELSAVESYQKALKKTEDDPRSAQLRQMLADHNEAVADLRAHVTMHTTEAPSDDSGWWGSFTAAFQGLANLFGDSSALSGLKQGEEHGVKEYERALEDESLTFDCRQVIREKLLPRAKQHVQMLDALIDAD